MVPPHWRQCLGRGNHGGFRGDRPDGHFRGAAFPRPVRRPLAGCRSADSGAQSGVGRAGASCGPGSSAAGFALHDAELFGLGDLGRSVDRTVERHAASGMEPHGFVGGGRPGRPAAARVGRRGVARLPRHCGAGLPDAARRHGRAAPARGRGERGRPALARSDRRNEPRTAASSALRGGRLRAARDHVPRGGRGPHRRAAEHEQHQPSPLLRAGDRADGGGRGAGRFAEAGAARRGSGEQLAGQHAGFVRLRRRLSRDPLPGGAFEPRGRTAGSRRRAGPSAIWTGRTPARSRIPRRGSIPAVSRT